MSIENYVEQFGVLGIDDVLNTNTVSQMLYSAHIQKFRVQYSDDEHQLLHTFQTRVYTLIDSMHGADYNYTIQDILEYIFDVNPILVDIIIMQWVLPTPTFRSQIIYRNIYKKNINNHLQKLIDIFDTNVVDQFIVETLSKNGNVPIHCIDLIWNTMQQFVISLFFINSISTDYMEIIRTSDNEVSLTLSLTLLFRMGLGDVPNSKNITFRAFILHSIKNKKHEMIHADTTGNLKKQLSEMYNNPLQYGFTVDNFTNI
jgi:hypothetical protein